MTAQVALACVPCRDAVTVVLPMPMAVTVPPSTAAIFSSALDQTMVPAVSDDAVSVAVLQRSSSSVFLLSVTEGVGSGTGVSGGLSPPPEQAARIPVKPNASISASKRAANFRFIQIPSSDIF